MPPEETRFKPGQSGNPGGRPKTKSLSRAYRAQLEAPLPGDPKKTYAEAIAERLAARALKGDVAAARELADRTEGRPLQAIRTQDSTQVRYVVEAPSAETSEEWLARHAANRAAAEEIRFGKTTRPVTPQAWLAAHAESQRQIAEADMGQIEAGEGEPKKNS